MEKVSIPIDPPYRLHVMRKQHHTTSMNTAKKLSSNQKTRYTSHSFRTANAWVWVFMQSPLFEDLSQALQMASLGGRYLLASEHS